MYVVFYYWIIIGATLYTAELFNLLKCIIFDKLVVGFVAYVKTAICKVKAKSTIFLS